MGSTKTNSSFKRKLIGVAVISCFAGNTAHAAPTGAAVASGSASITTSGNTLTVTNTPNAIINWASFSIDTNETVRFVQQSASSAVLNRVTGSDTSSILGALQSNGKVFLINPNGIMFGAGAQIDVNGLVASTLNMTDADFLNGRLRFNADRAVPGNVSNAGEIRTPDGGFVYLLAPSVENSGIITTPGGEAILAAGNSVELVDSVNPSQRVLVSAKSQDINLSQLMTESNGNIFSVLNTGTVSANTVVQDATGKIFFKSAGNIQTTATSVVEARGDSAANGGSIIAFADNAGFYAGAFDISGKNGGFIETSGGYLDVDGISLNLRALDPSGKGGTWLLDPYDILIDNNAYGGGSCSGTAPTQGCFATSSHIYVGTIQTALNNGGDVFISTSDPAGNGTGLGDITLDASINHTGSYGSHLWLDADRDIIFTALGDITNSGTAPLAVNLNAGRDIFFNSSLSIVDIKGGFYAFAGQNIFAGGSIAAPEVLMFAGGNITVSGDITAVGNAFHDANIGLNANGNISISGANGLFASDAIDPSTIWLDAGGDIGINALVRATSGNYSNISMDAGGAITVNADVTAFGLGTNSVFMQGSNITVAQTVKADSYGSGTATGDAWVNLFSPGAITVSGNVQALSDYGGAFIDLDGKGGVTLTTALVKAETAYGGLTAVEILADASILNVNNSTVEAYGGDVLLVSQNLQITNSVVKGDYIGLNYEPSFIQTNTEEFFSFNSTSTLTVDSSTVHADFGLGFSGNNVTLQNGSDLTSDGQMHGIVINDLKLDASSLYTYSEMLLEVGGHIFLGNSSNITVVLPNTLFFHFPLLASGGWLVDGVAETFGTSGSGSYIEVNGAPPILGSNFFVTYGGLSTISGTISSVNNDTLTAADTPTIIQDTTLATAPTASDFFGTGTTESTATTSDAGTATDSGTVTGTDAGTATDAGTSTDSATATDSGTAESVEETASTSDGTAAEQSSEQEQQEAEDKPQQCS